MGTSKKRKELYLRHLRKQRLGLQLSGKLIEENHNGGDYSPGFVQRFISWRFFELWMKTQKYKDQPSELVRYFSKLKPQFQTLLLHWPDGKLERGREFWLIYKLQNLYRDGKTQSLVNELNNVFKQS